MLVLTGAASCVAGARPYGGGTPSTSVAEFGSPGCSIQTPASVPASEVRLFMIHGRTAFSLLVLDKKGKGIEIENYWKDAEGHHFVANVDKGMAWHYAIPDKRGANGKLSSYLEYKLRPEGDHTLVDGEAKESCELKFVAAEPVQAEQAANAAKPGSGAAQAACLPGETRECVGSAACKGGQACLQDRSGFGPCDCGSGTSEPPANGGTTGVNMEEKTLEGAGQ